MENMRAIITFMRNGHDLICIAFTLAFGLGLIEFVAYKEEGRIYVGAMKKGR